MKQVSIVSIGNELLNGQTVDTNAACLGARLLEAGLFVASCCVAADEIDSVVHALTNACEDADVVIATGGLGPTDDDVTRQALAKFLAVPLEFQEQLLRPIEQFFTARNLQMPAKNKSQAYIPAGTKPLENTLGTAPGIMASKNSKMIFVLPGVPAEMKQMFEQSVLPQLGKFTADSAIIIRRLQCFGTGESNIAGILGDMMQRGRNPQIDITASVGMITIHIIATADDKSVAEKMAQKDERHIKDLLGDIVFGTDRQSLAEIVGKKLAETKKTVAVAESCTGGLLAKLITDVPGASGYFTEGWITYGNRAKIDRLHVPPDLIDKYGAVSEQVAEAMAKAAKSIARSDFAVAITGIAGPTGATEQKPLGLVYISIASEQKCSTEKFILPGDRQSIRCRAAQAALNLLRLKL